MKKKIAVDLSAFAEYLAVPRTIDEIKKKFGKGLKHYFQEAKKDFRLIRTDEKKLYLAKKGESISRKFAIIDAVNENGAATENAKAFVFPKWKKIRVVPMGDINYGHPLYDKKRMEKYVEWISRDEHVFTFLNGNCFSKITDSKVFNKIFEDFRKEIYEPLKNKILFIVGGPNEKAMQAHKKISINPLKILADLDSRNKIPFFPDQAHVVLSFQDSGKHLKMFAIHGESNAVKVGAKLNAAMDFNFADADVVIVSNLNYTSVKRVEILTPCPNCPNGLDVEQKKKYIITLPSFLKYEGSRDAAKGRRPYYEGQVNIFFRYSDGKYCAASGELKEESEVLYD